MTGILRDRYGFRAYVKVGTHQREKRFKRGTPVSTMNHWRDEVRVALRKLHPHRSSAGTFGGDVARYLQQVRAMPTYAQRVTHLQLWTDALGPHTARHNITAEHIRTVLQDWRQTCGPATCNKRRTALMHLWSVLDGKGASNPVRDVPKFPAPHALPRGRDPHVIDAALLLTIPSRMRASCRVLLWTGLRPAELQRAEPDDVDLTHRTVIARTAKGGRVRVIPLTPQAVTAWEEFMDEKAWHRVPQAAPMNRWLKKRTGIADLRVYDLRHSYATALARHETRLDVIAALLGHSTLELSRRYTLASVTPDALAATVKLGATDSRTASEKRVSMAESGGRASG